MANDTHLELTIPSIWYEVHLTAPGWNVKGFTLPGAPMVIIGHNERIAWGFTNNGSDVQDLYIETFNPAASDEYRVKGSWTKAQIIDGRFGSRAHRTNTEVVVTRHGPVLARDGTAYAMRWTATEPGGLANSYNWLGAGWKRIPRGRLKQFGVGTETVYADVDGNIRVPVAARVPIRKKRPAGVPVGNATTSGPATFLSSSCRRLSIRKAG